MKQFVLTQFQNQKLGILFKDGKAQEIRSYEETSRIGNIVVAHVSKLAPNINAAFVDIEKNQSCYLAMDDYHGEPLKNGALVTVQVMRDRIKSKAPAVTTELSLTGKYAVTAMHKDIGVSAKITDSEKRKILRTLMRETIDEAADEWRKQEDGAAFGSAERPKLGGIVRTQAECADPEDIRTEIRAQVSKLLDIYKSAEYAAAYSCLYRPETEYIRDARLMLAADAEVVTDLPEVCEAVPEIPLYTDAYALTLRYSLPALMEKVLSKRVYLKSGAYLVIEPTEAMTVVDVNSGKSVRGRVAEEQFLKINTEAAHEIARQLRLRNLSGIIAVDFINMKEESNRQELLRILTEDVREDSMRTSVVDMTALGLVELTRQKCKRPLHEIFHG